ncbi:MAG: hypothetical protein A2Y38_17450 [Spirochaetes bacterium GWB1_59_5]|nr:MAG: hypothetical protein A2Y38_17450 [Spirochaetes bacterium GWB1_59_5]
MANEVVPYDPQKFAEALRDRIRAGIMDVIPPEQIDALIRAEAEKWLVATRVKDHYGNWVEGPSGLGALVLKELEIWARESIKTHMAKPEFGNGYSTQVTGFVLDELKKRAPEMLESLIVKLIGEGLNAFRQQLNSSAQRF